MEKKMRFIYEMNKLIHLSNIEGYKSFRKFSKLLYHKGIVDALEYDSLINIYYKLNKIKHLGTNETVTDDDLALIDYIVVTLSSSSE